MHFQLSTALALLSAAVFVLAGYGDSCHNERVYDGILSGECFDRGGGRVQTSIDLSQCVGWTGKRLVCDGK